MKKIIKCEHVGERIKSRGTQKVCGKPKEGSYLFIQFIQATTKLLLCARLSSESCRGLPVL